MLSLLTGVSGWYSVLEDDYNPDNFFSKFDFFTGHDPTNGFVRYIDEGRAWNQGLIRKNGDSVYIGVDHTNQAPMSKKAYTRGFICGIWPAFWMLGRDNGPFDGEIDIIEGVHMNSNNHMALHTDMDGHVLTTDCYAYMEEQTSNQGCSISVCPPRPPPNSYGDGFNAGGGGFYALEWTSDFIKIWFLPRDSAPEDIYGSTPEPANWGRPAAQFSGPCDINKHFRWNHIIFDVTFCGDWAGAAWRWPQAGCSGLADSFSDAYWEVRSLRVWSG
ncbi:concanavalin A-like lectin/glucanase domain-containing protein [Kalaharituber pfeilii]|nr:concanavalin A-like lectin/glucanase domain-containing protein [Kalaharituber pfeilii]